MDDKSKSISELHRIYVAGNLRVLAGAGVSKASGFPDWDVLNRRLLHKYLEKTLGSVGTNHIAPGNSLLEPLTTDVYEHLGRDAVAELVLRSAETPERFREWIAAALYQGRGLDNLYVSDLQRQIVALTMSPQTSVNPGSLAWKGNGKSCAKLYTTNFDPLLELAMATAFKEAGFVGVDPDPSASFRRFRLPLGASDQATSDDLPQIIHLHGWIDPDQDSGGEIVYAESHYLSLQRTPRADANVQTEDLFNKNGATLIFGMSLADPNIRRLLYTRSSEVIKKGSVSVYHFMRQRDRGLASVYAAKFWEALDVKLIPFTEYSELPNLVRQIQWGTHAQNGAPGWFAAASTFRVIKLDTDAWFDFASPLLTTLHQQVERMYLTEPREAVRISFFAPASLSGTNHPEPKIYELGSTDFDGKFEASSAKQLLVDVEKRSLDIRCESVQGLAGLAFLEGSIREVTGDNTDGLDYNFTEETKRAFDRDGYRNWRSLLAVPILGGPHWLPRGVVCIQSNFGNPFWKALEKSPESSSDFRGTLLAAGRLLLNPKV